MDLSVRVMSRVDTLSSILHFQTDNTSSYWRGSLFKAYPFLDEEKCRKLVWKDRKEYLTIELSKIYDKIEINLRKKCSIYQEIWDKNKENINFTYSKVFGLDCNNLLNTMIAEISLNPICPRNVKNLTYSVVWAGDEFDFLKTSLHEMIHFVWFYIWKKHFGDSWSEYEAPNLKWILSEMVVDTFVKNTDIGNIYPEKYKDRPAYKYFYEMKINNQFILDTLNSLFKNSQNIVQFMEEAYHYCQKYEEDIRKQVL